MTTITPTKGLFVLKHSGKRYFRKFDSRTRKYPYYVNLPIDCKSPTNSVYKRYDIVKQDAVLISYADSRNRIRSRAPFEIRVAIQTTSGENRIKHLFSKTKKDNQ